MRNGNCKTICRKYNNLYNMRKQDQCLDIKILSSKRRIYAMEIEIKISRSP